MARRGRPRGTSKATRENVDDDFEDDSSIHASDDDPSEHGLEADAEGDVCMSSEPPRTTDRESHESAVQGPSESQQLYRSDDTPVLRRNARLGPPDGHLPLPPKSHKPRRKSTLRTSGPHKCPSPSCAASYPSAIGLRQHLRIKHDVYKRRLDEPLKGKLRKCGKCGNWYTYGNIANHFRNAHAEDDDAGRTYRDEFA